MADQQMTISLDVIIRGAELIVIPLVGWLFRNAWKEFKMMIRNINAKVENTNSSLNILTNTFNTFQLDSVERLTRLETYAETNGHHPPAPRHND